MYGMGAAEVVAAAEVVEVVLVAVPETEAVADEDVVTA